MITCIGLSLTFDKKGTTSTFSLASDTKLPWFSGVHVFPTKQEPVDKLHTSEIPDIDSVGITDDAPDDLADNGANRYSTMPQIPCALPDQFMQCRKCLQFIEVGMLVCWGAVVLLWCATYHLR